MRYVSPVWSMGRFMAVLWVVLFIRLRVVPHFSSGIVERAKRECAWKSPHARKGDTRRGDLWYQCAYNLHYTKPLFFFNPVVRDIVCRNNTSMHINLKLFLVFGSTSLFWRTRVRGILARIFFIIISFFFLLGFIINGLNLRLIKIQKKKNNLAKYPLIVTRRRLVNNVSSTQTVPEIFALEACTHSPWVCDRDGNIPFLYTVGFFQLGKGKQ